MGKGEDSSLTVGVFTKYLMHLEENLATKADIASVKAEMTGVKAEMTSRLDKMEVNMATKADIAEMTSRLNTVESGTWSRLDDIEQKMATKDDLASVKEDTVRIRKAMMEDDIDMGKVKKRLSTVEGAE